MTKLEAIKKLIKLYETRKDSHSYKGCPLCKVVGTTVITTGCQKCPNYCFRNPEHELPCISRIDDYRDLNWNNHEHKLVEFWTEVYEYMSKLPRPIITKQVEKDILEIAEKYK